MKLTLVLLSLALVNFGYGREAQVSGDRTITKIVKLLQEMLDKSKKDGDHERVLYAKYKCYCDDNRVAKTEEIKELTKQIALLEAEIEKIQGGTGGLSEEVAKLLADQQSAEKALKEATAIRGKEKKAFEANKKDLETAIGQLKEAIKVLAEQGADQTMEDGADHEKFMAKGKVKGFKGYKGYTGDFLQRSTLDDSAKSALQAASVFLNMKQRQTLESFLQAPFTGTYTAQSGEIVGILKNMKDTFKKDLKEAIAAEKLAVAAFLKLKKTLEAKIKLCKETRKEKQKKLGANDSNLADKRKQLKKAKKQKKDDEEFLEKLEVMCKDKAKEYQERQLMRTNEEAAIAEAISILNSDEAFMAFGKVKATKSGKTKLLQAPSFLQVSSEMVRKSAVEMLREAAQQSKSLRLAQVAALMQNTRNPFTKVLKVIDDMLKLIKEEAAEDKKNKEWCEKERKEKKATLKSLGKQQTTLEGEIEKLDKLIDDAETGLRVQIKKAEATLEKAIAEQKKLTKDRMEENLDYQENIADIVKAEDLLGRAIKVLKVYYSQILKKKAFLQEDPEPPSTWKKGGFEGQSKSGSSAIDMLEFVLKESNKEHMKAHADEDKDQGEYQAAMQAQVDLEKKTVKNLADLKSQLAKAIKEREDKKQELEKTIGEIKATKAYLLDIKPGCDFIKENYADREKYRKIESTALKKAIKLIQGTPAYKTSVNEKDAGDFGDCKAICCPKQDGAKKGYQECSDKAAQAHAKCKACMNDVSVDGWCAGHGKTPGCDVKAVTDYSTKHDKKGKGKTKEAKVVKTKEAKAKLALE